MKVGGTGDQKVLPGYKDRGVTLCKRVFISKNLELKCHRIKGNFIKNE